MTPAVVIATCIFATLVSAPAPEAAPDARAAEAQPADTPVGVLWIRAADVSYDALADEIGLRLPEVELAPYGHSRPRARSGSLLVFVDVRRASGREGELTLTLVVSDGRAYDRNVELDPGASPKDSHELVARNIANLVFGIESGTVPPDRADVALPEPQHEPEPCPACPPPPAPTPMPKAAPVPTPRVEIGPALGVAVLTGLGPPVAFDRFTAWGGELDLGVRWRRGAAFVLGLRTSGRGHPRGARIVRFRVVVGGGWVWRPASGSFELESLVGGSVEPWLVLDDARRIGFSLAQLPTLGVWARLAPGYLVRSRNARIAARIGAFAELDLAYAPASDGIIAVYQQGGDQMFPMFRVGGPELVVGAHARLWFPVW